MGEQHVQLLEQNVKHNMEDIRELKKRVSKVEENVFDLKTNQQIANQSIAHVMETLSELKVGFKELDEKMDENSSDQLKAYKTVVWQVGGSIIATIIGGIILAVFFVTVGLK